MIEFVCRAETQNYFIHLWGFPGKITDRKTIKTQLWQMLQYESKFYLTKQSWISSITLCSFSSFFKKLFLVVFKTYFKRWRCLVGCHWPMPLPYFSCHSLESVYQHSWEKTDKWHNQLKFCSLKKMRFKKKPKLRCTLVFRRVRLLYQENERWLFMFWNMCCILLETKWLPRSE